MSRNCTTFRFAFVIIDNPHSDSALIIRIHFVVIHNPQCIHTHIYIHICLKFRDFIIH